MNADRAIGGKIDDRRAGVAARGVNLITDRVAAHGNVRTGVGLLNLVPRGRDRRTRGAVTGDANLLAADGGRGWGKVVCCQLRLIWLETRVGIRKAAEVPPIVADAAVDELHG